MPKLASKQCRDIKGSSPDAAGPDCPTFLNAFCAMKLEFKVKAEVGCEKIVGRTAPFQSLEAASRISYWVREARPEGQTATGYLPPWHYVGSSDRGSTPRMS